MKIHITLLFFILLLLLPVSSVYASGPDGNLNDALDLFDVPEETPLQEQDSLLSDDPDISETSFTKFGMVQLSGEISLFATFPVDGKKEEGKGDFTGISQLKTGLELDADIRSEGPWQAHAGIRTAYDAVPLIKGRSHYSDQYLADSEFEFELHEAYVLASPTRKMDIKIGRQIVAWGTSETLRVIDVLNPMDKRLPGQTDIEDLRLPVVMTRLDYFPDTSWSITGIVVHETRFDKEPPWGSDFYPCDFKLPRDPESYFSLENQELAFAFTGRFSGWDMTLNVAWVLDDTPYFENGQRKHARVGMAGGTTQIASGNWLFKAEGALFTGLRYTEVPKKEYCRGDLLAGAEYSGFEETTITVELLNRYIMGLDSEAEDCPSGLRQNDTALSLRLQRDYMNDTLHLLAVGTISIPAGRGGLGRVEASYDISDSIAIRSGFIYYIGGDNPFYDLMSSNDRFFTEVKYSF